MKAICALLLGLVALVAAGGAPGYNDIAHGFNDLGARGYGVAHPGFGFYPGVGYPYGYGINDEHHYRAHPGFPVHVGNGNFYYLGIFPGSCATHYAYGFYYANDSSSFIVCDHGRAHRFQCPAGTKNSNAANFAYNTPYSMAALCGEHVK